MGKLLELGEGCWDGGEEGRLVAHDKLDSIWETRLNWLGSAAVTEFFVSVRFSFVFVPKHTHTDTHKYTSSK